MEEKKVKVKKWIIILDIIITLLATLIILYGVGNAFYSRVNKRIELVHVDQKILLKRLVTKEMVIVDKSAPNEIRIYKNMNDVVIDKTNERAIFYKLKTNDTCIIEVVGDQTFWFHTIPNITRVFECRKDK